VIETKLPDTSKNPLSDTGSGKPIWGLDFRLQNVDWKQWEAYEKRVFFILTLLLMVAVGIGSAIGAEKVLKLGASVCITGRLAKEGGYVKDGYTLWMEEVNRKGGIKVGSDRYKVEIIFYDDKSDPQTGAKLTEKLITEDKVKFILGPYGSGITLATSAIGEKYKVLTVACQANANNIYERGFKYIISILPATYYLGRVDLSQKLKPAAKPTQSSRQMMHFRILRQKPMMCKEKG
jgi:ABC-type branched-subunit amino acid transport system substrate-binding protein